MLILKQYVAIVRLKEQEAAKEEEEYLIPLHNHNNDILSSIHERNQNQVQFKAINKSKQWSMINTDNQLIY